MNPQIEHGVSQALKALASLSEWVILPAQESLVTDLDTPRVVCECSELEHLGDGLCKALVRVYLITPAHGGTITSHRASAVALANALYGFGSQSSVFETYSGAQFRGSFVKIILEQIEDSAWITVADLLLGVKIT